ENPTALPIGGELIEPEFPRHHLNRILGEAQWVAFDGRPEPIRVMLGVGRLAPDADRPMLREVPLQPTWSIHLDRLSTESVVGRDEVRDTRFVPEVEPTGLDSFSVSLARDGLQMLDRRVRSRSETGVPTG